MATGGSIWAHGSAGKAPARRQRAVESSGATRGAVLQAGGGSGMARSGGQRCPAAAAREAEQAGRLEEGESGLKRNFRNFRDPTVNQQ